MTEVTIKNITEISELSEEKQILLATYIKNHLNELLAEAEKEKRIEESTYLIDDFNEETQQTIINIEKENNLTICKNQEDLYNQLGI